MLLRRLLCDTFLLLLTCIVYHPCHTFKKYDTPNLPDYRFPADGLVFFLGRPLGCLGLFSICSFGFGLRPRFFGSGFGTGVDSPRASSSSKTVFKVCTPYPSSVAGMGGPSDLRHAEDRKSYHSSLSSELTVSIKLPVNCVPCRTIKFFPAWIVNSYFPSFERSARRISLQPSIRYSRASPD